MVFEDKTKVKNNSKEVYNLSCNFEYKELFFLKQSENEIKILM